MIIDESVLKNEEKITFVLRALYQKSGYMRYKMSKFEEYDYYAVNRDFLVSDNIISFTDTNGKLMALKPDVTLSIVRGSKDIPGEVNKVYYDENVYRVSKGSHGFKEILQAGIECIGDITESDIGEVIVLAAKSLKVISDESVLTISHQGVIAALLDTAGLQGEDRKKALKFIGEKNLHDLAQLMKENMVADEVFAAMDEVLAMSGKADVILEELKAMAIKSLRSKEMQAAAAALQNAAAELEKTVEALKENGCGEMAVIDFSVVNDMNYYNGIVFKGYVKGIPAGILSGGQYDYLLSKLGKKSRAIGFAVYMDMLERFEVKELGNA